MSLCPISRRMFIGSAATTVLLRGGAQAQSDQPDVPKLIDDIRALLQRAAMIGPAPVAGGLRQKTLPKLDETNIYREAMPRLVELVDAPPVPLMGTSFNDEAGLLLSRLNELVHEVPAAFAAVKEEGFPLTDELAASYVAMFNSCEIRPECLDFAHRDLKIMIGHKSRYQAVAKQTSVPWYFIGGIHALECSFSFKGHLHNGNSLKARTTTKPKGHPEVWLPPSDWESSAKDALEYMSFTRFESWSLPETLYRFENFNGFGYRIYKKINSPYLWSFSSYYVKGKYRSDSTYDPELVSDQTGNAVMMKMLADAGEISV